MCQLLCILTSEWVLRTLLTGRNRLSDAKATFSVTKKIEQKNLRKGAQNHAKHAVKEGENSV